MAHYNEGKRFHYDHSFFASPIKLGRWELIQIGELCLEPFSETDIHNQFCHEISYIISGEGIFEHNGKKTSVKAGDIIISPNNGSHNIIAGEHNELFFAYAGFKFNSYEEQSLGKLAEFFSGRNARFKTDGNNIYNSFRHCMDEFYRNSPTDYLMVEACLTELIVSCYRIFTSDTGIQYYTSDVERSGHLIYRVIKYAERNAQNPISVAEIARAVGYSPYYLSHLFKEKMGITLQEYIANKRIELAKERMKLNRFTVTEVSEQLGYSNLQTFSRTFKQKTGQTPTQYIKEISAQE